jgi:hypothetical protein
MELVRGAPILVMSVASRPGELAARKLGLRAAQESTGISWGDNFDPDERYRSDRHP